jgi:hypothetical protein
MSRNPCYINVYLCQEQAECGTTSKECNKAADSGFGSEVMSWFDEDVDISETTHVALKASSLVSDGNTSEELIDDGGFEIGYWFKIGFWSSAQRFIRDDCRTVHGMLLAMVLGWNGNLR